MTAAVHLAEISSGKDVAYENFPVGSWLLPPALRPHVAVFYGFARAIDDIADNPDLMPDDKVARLDGYEEALLGRDAADPAFEAAHRMRRVLTDTGITPQHCLDLLAAFKQDAIKLRYRDWDDLMGYCIRSAAPVGRFLLDLHGGSKDGYGPSDALCNALQVINHLQDCKEDHQLLDRVYVPQDWMVEAGVAIEDLDAPVSTPGLRTVLDRTLDATEVLLVEARRLPGGLKSRRLAMESGAIIKIAERLCVLLRQQDPLATRVALTKPGYVWCCSKGVVSSFLSSP